MKLIEILKLVGFATGATLHFYIAWLIWNRRLGSRQSLTQAERTFLLLGLCLGFWFLGNLLTTLHVIVLGSNRVTAGLRVWDTLTMIGISVLPAALLHAHIAFWGTVDNSRVLSQKWIKVVTVALYVPLLGLPYAIYRIWTNEYRPLLLDVRPLLVPYSVWFVFALWTSASIDWALKDRFGQTAHRERQFFKRLSILLFLIGALEFVVVAVLRSGPNDYPYVFYVLLSLLPTFLVAYHVYRYKLVEVIIKTSLVYAAFAILFIAVYTYVVRYIDQLLVEQFGVRAGVIEVILILGMVALAGPVVRWIERGVRKLFAREVGLYRDVVRQVTTGAAGFGELEPLIRYTEETIRNGLDVTRVKIVPFGSELGPGPERRLAEKMIEWQVDAIEKDDDLKSVDATTAYALKREDQLIGLMLIAAEPRSLTSEKRSILDVLAGQVAVEVESCRLVEEKVRLERELLNRERLATLGQMAATVAHEVKNPLSSIKSIVQVMREEAANTGFDRDLELIVSEIDRLNRTVSQLLAFSRPSSADSRPVQISEMLDSTVTLLRNEARQKGVQLLAAIDTDIVLTGSQAAAVKEAMSNLIINAVQATPTGGSVAVEAVFEEKPRDQLSRGEFCEPTLPGRPPTVSGISPGRLVLSVTDSGPGIPDETQHRVFEPFFTTKARGTGLGLAIVQRRATELGGSVELVSPVAKGRGTRFRLVVPISIAAVEGEATH
jgi:signal transduction histidine kinase